MRLLTLLLLLPLSAAAQSPWTREPPNWWMSLHGQYITVPIDLAQVVPSPPSVGPTVSFSPQGLAALKAVTGRNIRGVGIYDLVVCSPTGAFVQGGSVYQTAVGAGISPLGPAEAKFLFTQTVSRSPGNLLLEIGADASIALPVLGQSGLISMSSKYVVSLLAGHVLFDNIQNQVRAHLPDPSSVTNLLLDPQSTIVFPNGACKEATMIARFSGKTQVVGTFPIH